MTRYSKQKQVSEETQDEALKLARSNQKPGQTKEQTKLIAQGVQKGIDQYKKQHKAKSRELSKQLKKVKNTHQDDTDIALPDTAKTKKFWLPWSLLVISWFVFVTYLLLGES
jgi:iron-sulfur cluster repair protein YtfE (RIC family)